MRPGPPLVSVIIPVFNGQDYLAQAVRSVLGQDYGPLEIIAVDDGSTDGTSRILASFGNDLRTLTQDNRGSAAARNRGLLSSRGEAVAFLDADDLWPEDKLRTQVARLWDDPELDIVLGRIRRIGPGGTERGGPPDSGGDLIDLQLGCGLFRRTVFDKVGLFDDSLRFSEDYDWFLRAREKKIPMIILDSVALFYRVHGGNITRSHESGDYQLPLVLKKSLDRRRLAGEPARDLPKLFEVPEQKASGKGKSRRSGETAP